MGDEDDEWRERPFRVFSEATDVDWWCLPPELPAELAQARREREQGQRKAERERRERERQLREEGGEASPSSPHSHTHVALTSQSEEGGEASPSGRTFSHPDHSNTNRHSRHTFSHLGN